MIDNDLLRLHGTNFKKFDTIRMLQNLKRDIRNPVSMHVMADRSLLDYINDNEITEAYLSATDTR